MSEAFIFDHYPLARDQAPPGWAVTSVDHIARLVASGFPSGKHNQEGVGVPHIPPMNIDREGRLDLNSLKYVDGAIPRASDLLKRIAAEREAREREAQSAKRKKPVSRRRRR